MIALDLKLNERLFAPDYVERRLDSKGHDKTHSKSEWANQNHCHYQGWAIDISTGLALGAVGLSTCHREDGAWGGLALIDGRRYRVDGVDIELSLVVDEALAFEDDGLEAFEVLPVSVMNSEAEVDGPPEFETTGEADEVDDFNHGEVPADQPRDAGQPLYIELGIVNDHAFQCQRE